MTYLLEANLWKIGFSEYRVVYGNMGKSDYRVIGIW